MEHYDNPTEPKIRSCLIRITSRHIVHDVQRFAKYGVIPSLFQSDPEAGTKSGGIEPEDFPEEMNDALDEILHLENIKYGSPLEVTDPYDDIPDEEEEEYDDGYSEEISPTIDDFNRKLEAFMRMISCGSDDEDDDTMVFETRGTIECCLRDGRPVVEVKYTEDESMDNTETIVRYDPAKPRSAAVCHTGGVLSTLICDEGKRHITVYETPIMPFELAVYTRRCRGGFSWDGGVLSLDYILELRGADLQRTIMTIEAFPLN